MRILIAIMAAPLFMAAGGLVLAWKCLYFVCERLDRAIDDFFNHWM